MHELAAPLLFVIQSDCDTFSALANNFPANVDDNLTKEAKADLAGVLLMYWKMTFCPKFIRCFGLLFVLIMEILKTQFYLTGDKSWVGLD